MKDVMREGEGGRRREEGGGGGRRGRSMRREAEEEKAGKRRKEEVGRRREEEHRPLVCDQDLMRKRLHYDYKIRVRQSFMVKYLWFG